MRKEGNFLFNTIHNNGELIVSRRPNPAKKKSPDDFAVCPNCKGFMVRRTMFQHYKKCKPETSGGVKNVLLNSDILNVWCHKSASASLKKNIFPPMRDDDVFKVIRYDYLIVIFGNKLCQKYRSQHFYRYIRQILRTLGRLLIAIKGKDVTITDFAPIFTPKKYDVLLDAVNHVACLSLQTYAYKKPTLAFNIGTYLKKCAKLLIIEYIKSEDFDKKNKVEQFLTVLDNDYGIAVNKTATENQIDIRRKKKVISPSSEDLEILRKYLENERAVNYNLLKSNFAKDVWLNLAKCSLSYVQIFNRRRAGEIERILIADFAKYHTIDDKIDQDIYNDLSRKAKNSAKNFVRFQIRGKLGRTVSVLLHMNWLKAIKLIIKFHEKADVPRENPYVFGVSGGSKFEFKHLRACDLLRNFAFQSAVKHPETIRGTLLRKHIATIVQKLNLNDSDMTFFADFMGHDKKIHDRIYRLPIATREIGQMTNLLSLIEKNNIEKHKGQNLKQICDEDTSSNDSDDSITVNRETNYDQSSLQENNSIQNEGDSRDDFMLTDSETEDVASLKTRNKTTPEKNRKDATSNEDVTRFRIKRVTWTTPEKYAVRNEFNEFLKSNDTSLPSLQECYAFIRDNAVMSKIRLWIHNQKRHAIRNLTNTLTREPWTTPQKHLLRKIFRKQIVSGKTPSNVDCRDVLEQGCPTFFCPWAGFIMTYDFAGRILYNCIS